MSWFNVVPQSMGEVKASSELLGLEDVFEMDTDIAFHWLDVGEDFRTDVLETEYTTLSIDEIIEKEQQEFDELYDDDRFYDDVHVAASPDSDHMEAWDSNWFWTKRREHESAIGRYYHPRSEPVIPKVFKPAPKLPAQQSPEWIAAFQAKRQREWELAQSLVQAPVTISEIATSTKEVEPVPDIKQPMFDPKATFTFKSGVVIAVDFATGEFMHKGSEYRKAFNAKSVQSYLDQGYQFEHKHEVLHRPQ